MGFEIEKKYRLTDAQRARVLQRLAAVDAKFEGEDFEENILFSGGILSLKECVLRLRKTEKRVILTYKESLNDEPFSDSGVKRRIEHETEIKDGKALQAILESLGYQPSLVYEKRRQTWALANVEVVVDELPFGLFLEIEGTEKDIRAAESKLQIQDLLVEPSPYPALTANFGVRKRGNLIEARFV